MSDLGDRLMLLLIAGTAVLGLLVGYLAGFGEALVPNDQQWLFFAGLTVLFLVIMAGIWMEIRPGSDT